MLDKAVTDAEALINAIGEVAYDDACKAKIDEARAAYVALTAEQQALVTNIGTLTDAETEYAALEAAAALAQAKTDAKDALETYKDLGDYREAQQNAVILEVTLGKSAIDAATTIADVNTALANAKTAIDAIKTDAQLTAEELATAKTDAKDALDNYVNADDYRAAQQTELANAIANGKDAIDNAADTDAVATALANAKVAIDAIKTDAQLTAEEEAAAALNQAKNMLSNAIDVAENLEGLLQNGNYTDIAATLQTAITAAQQALNSDAATVETLTAAREAISTATTAALNARYAADVTALINAIDDPVVYTTECSAKITAARDAYDALTAEQKALVSNYTTLTAAETAYAALAAAATPQDQISATISDKIEVNFMLDLDKRDDPQTITVEHQKMISAATFETVETLTFNAADLTKKGSLYYLTLPVAPAQGADRYVVYIDGTPIAQDIYSVKDYCEFIIANGNNPAYAPYVDLATAMLEYCQAANAYFDYIPVNFAETTNAQAAVDAVAGRTSTLTLDTDARNYFNTASYMALTVPEYRFYVKEGMLTEAQAAALNSKITVTGPTGVKARFVKNVDKNDAIMLEVTGIDVEHMNEAVIVTIEGVGTITFCGNDFARLLAKNAATAVLGAALYNYGAEAKACFGNNG